MNLYHAAASAVGVVVQEGRGQPQRFAQPVHHVDLQLGTSRTGGLFTSTDTVTEGATGMLSTEWQRLLLRSYPGESDAVDGVGQHLAQHGGPGRQGGVVGVHVGALPVDHLQGAERRTHQLVLLCHSRTSRL